MRIYKIDKTQQIRETDTMLKLTSEDVETLLAIKNMGDKVSAAGFMIGLKREDVELEEKDDTNELNKVTKVIEKVLTEYGNVDLDNISGTPNVSDDNKMQQVKCYRTGQKYHVMKKGKKNVTLLGDEGQKTIKRTTFDKGYKKL